MNDAIAIKVNNLSQTFRIPFEQKTQIKHYVLNPFHKTKYREFNALNDVSFEVKKGEFLGIIGRNGSGKSTLLKTLAGIYEPDKGSVKINGQMTPFLELGVGFNPELSGRENIFLNGIILGMTKKFLEKKFDEIVDFAEVRDFIDMPVKNYSSGMQVRLAFSIAIQSDADIYLVDEVLAVGDAGFQEKCFDVFRNFKKEGKTVVFVSHGMDSVKEFCDRVIWIDGGKVRIDNGTEEVVSHYQNEGNPILSNDSSTVKDLHFIKEIKTYAKQRLEKRSFTSEENITFEINLEVEKPENDLFVGLAIFDKNTNAWICGNNSFYDGFSPKINRGVNKIKLSFNPNYFNKGSFYYKASIFKGDPKNNLIYEVYDSSEFNEFVNFKATTKKNGLLQLPHTWR